MMSTKSKCNIMKLVGVTYGWTEIWSGLLAHHSSELIANETFELGFRLSKITVVIERCVRVVLVNM